MRRSMPLVLAVPLLFACAEGPAAPPAPAMEAQMARGGVSTTSAAGHWEIQLGPDFIGKYSFNAVRHADGSVTGEFQLKEGDARVHGTLSCMTILPDGKTAWIGGVIDHSTYGPQFEGRGALMQVTDGGEGKGALDLASDIVYGFRAPDAAQRFCDDGPAFYPFINVRPVIRGNIQVRP